MKALSNIVTLLVSTALLLVGHGMQLTLLPLRASAEGMSEFLVGLSASGYFLGFMVGCLLIPLLIARVGHIRGFAVLSAAMISALLALDLFDHWLVWLLLRVLTGTAMAGLYTVIESWLNSQSTSETRGRILALYTFITLVALLAGQFLINVGPVESPTPLMVAALFVALAIMPIGVTRRLAPTPLEAKRPRFPRLYQRSHSAFAGTVLSGMVGGGFWSLGALFARNYSTTPMDVTWFMSAAIAGGALMQYPIGWLSDRFDRRRVLAVLSLALSGASAAVALGAGKPWFLGAVFLFGATVMPLYAISLATAADVAKPSEFVEIGTSVLLLNALGAIIAPLAMGQLMAYFGPTALFWSSAVLASGTAAYLATQLRRPRPVSVSEQAPFSAAAADTAPVGFEMDPRGESQDTRN